MLTAIWSYRQGRGVTLMESWRQDGVQRWVWLVGWIGLVYGIQLSLLVLAILQVFVAYDFLLHPEGPAMMAIIISCTSVTRDAFEIGHVQRLTHQGVVVPTFPDGEALRKWIPQEIASHCEMGSIGFHDGGSRFMAPVPVGPIELQPIIQSLTRSRYHCVHRNEVIFLRGSVICSKYEWRQAANLAVISLVLDVAKFDLFRYLFSGTYGDDRLLYSCRADPSGRFYGNGGMYRDVDDGVYPLSGLAQIL